MQDHAVSFGPYRLGPRSGLTVGTRPIRLTPKALVRLCFLVERSGRVITKDELFGAVWPNTMVSRSAIHRLNA